MVTTRPDTFSLGLGFRRSSTDLRPSFLSPFILLPRRSHYIAMNTLFSICQAISTTILKRRDFPSGDFPCGLLSLWPEQENSDTAVDIVFVHGLLGDREKTWTAKSPPPWPKTLLPECLPHARIITFGYDARVVAVKETISVNKVRQHAQALMTDIANFRQKDHNRRPIIFVAHSLGGIVCKYAILLSKNGDRSTRDVYDSTLAIAFLGTPHEGSAMANFAISISRLLGLITQTNRNILKCLKSSSGELFNINHDFLTLIRRRAGTDKEIYVFCFYEELPLQGNHLVVPENSAILPGYGYIGIHSNHTDMAKFKSKGDTGFFRVSMELSRWVSYLPRPRTRKRLHLVAISRSNIRSTIDLVVCENDGEVYTSHWGSDWTNWKSLGGKFRAGAAVAVVARRPDHLDLFACGDDGKVYTSHWHERSEWTNWKSLEGQFPAGAAVAVVARKDDRVDLFACGKDGNVYTSHWHERSDWTNWKSLGGQFPAGVGMAAVARKDDHIDLFVCREDGQLYTSHWHERSEWTDWKLLGGEFPVGVEVTAVVARRPDHLDLFACGNDGQVYTSHWHERSEWTTWTSLEGQFPAGVAVAVVARKDDRVDLFACGKDGNVYTSHWHERSDWTNWKSLGGQFPAGATVAVAAREDEHLDLFVCGDERKVYTSHWHERSDWTNWESLGPYL
ncbi:hypothetical protein V1504DRAFT_94113 [Lipomyces starkeyi]